MVSSGRDRISDRRSRWDSQCECCRLFVSSSAFCVPCGLGVAANAPMPLIISRCAAQALYLVARPLLLRPVLPWELPMPPTVVPSYLLLRGVKHDGIKTIFTFATR